MTAALEVDASANGGSVVLAPGQALMIRLDENPTTGYRWALEASEGLQLDANVFIPGAAGVGAAGERRLTLQATAPGTHQLVIVQRREWEPPANAFARFELTVTALP
jgi:inhibitor of cysteine peptidase